MKCFNQYGALLCIVTVTLFFGGCAPESSGAMIEPTGMSHLPQTSLEVDLQVPEELPIGEAVELDFTLINHSDTGLYVLKWYTPLEGIAGEIFRVERDGQSIPYNGPLVMRGDPTSEAYVFLEAGASVSTTVDLAAVGETGSPVYDFSEPGKYTITFIPPRISHVARSERELATSMDDLGPLEIPCNRVTVEITSGPSSPKEAEAVQANPAAGLIYSTAGELWGIDGDGSAVPLIDQLGDNQPDVQVSMDGRWLACTSIPPGYGSRLVEADTWEMHPLDLPSDARLIDWIQP